MCGIAGYCRFNEKVGHGNIIAMNNALRHRGPDDEGFVAIDSRGGTAFPLAGQDSQVPLPTVENFSGRANCFLAHRRLAIVDVSPLGHQPMGTKEQDLWITFNGEVYNYQDLRNNLVALGYVFHSNTDTEVLLGAYREWGTDFVLKLNGMWSFVIYDARKKILFGSRDRFGVKPFYYLHTKEFFAFASEIKALLKVDGYTPRVNPQAVCDYLAIGWGEPGAGGGGFFEGVQELMPSQNILVEMESGKKTLSTYYTLDFHSEWEAFDAAKNAVHVEKVRELTLAAVESHLMSDVPVGSCLSGGVDSSSIVCSIKHLSQNQRLQSVGLQQKTFTASYKNFSFDESPWAQSVAEFAGAEWCQTFPSPEGLMDDLEDFVFCHDIPFGTTSMYAQYKVMQIAKEKGITVLLDGQGGDEIFSGYTSYYRGYFEEMLRHGAFGSLLREAKGLANAPTSLKDVFVSLARGKAVAFLPSSLRGKLLRKALPELSYLSDGLLDYAATSKRLSQVAMPKKSLNHLLHERICGEGIQALLRYEDRNAMHFSIEARTPFADDLPLIEYVFQIPSSYKIHHGWSKALLRQSMRGILPQNIAGRVDKIGFATPEYLWLSSNFEKLEEYLRSQPELNDYIKVEKLLQAWTHAIDCNRRLHLPGIWRFVNLALWLNLYGDRSLRL